jgi:hypothetical protein
VVAARQPFARSMRRVRGVLALHPTLHGTQGRPRQHVSDVLRGALVLAVGALDGLVLDAAIEAVAPVARADGLSSTFEKWVKEDPAGFWLALGAADRANALAEVGRGRLGSMTFQRAATIEGVLRDAAGCGAPWPAAAQRLSRTGVAWTPEQVRVELDAIVLRRHAIAHKGDVASGRRATPITLSYVAGAADIVEAVGLGVCDVVADRLRRARRVTR